MTGRPDACPGLDAWLDPPEDEPETDEDSDLDPPDEADGEDRDAEQAEER